MAPVRTRAPGERLVAGAGTFEGLLEVMLEFVIREISCL
jgi:hypothetical protein